MNGRGKGDENMMFVIFCVMHYFLCYALREVAVFISNPKFMKKKERKIIAQSYA